MTNAELTEILKNAPHDASVKIYQPIDYGTCDYDKQGFYIHDIKKVEVSLQSELSVISIYIGLDAVDTLITS